MGCKQSQDIQPIRPANSLWKDDDKKERGKELSFKLKKSTTVNPKSLAHSVTKAEQKGEADCESAAKLTEKVDLNKELEKLTPEMVKDKTVKIVEEGE